MRFNVVYPELFYEYLFLLFVYILEHTTNLHTRVLFIMAIFSISEYVTVVIIMK